MGNGRHYCCSIPGRLRIFQSFAACKIYSTFQKWTKNIEKNWEEIVYKIPYKWKCLIFSCNFLRLQKKISFFRENTPKIRIIC